jgi:cyclopropane-fatty-acyl-phospholipid synthase
VLLKTTAPGKGAAPKLAALIEPLFGGSLPIRLRAWDGSEAGPADAPVVVLKSRKALRRLAYNPGELGLSQAYVTGEIDVEGDLFEGFRRIWATVREKDLAAGRPPVLPVIKTALRYGVIGLPPKAPVSQAKIQGKLHSLLRDRDAISHHYDLSNDFYHLILDPNMAYSCAYYVTGDEDVKTAQDQKLELIAQKLGVVAGGRHLDIGCGWGSLSLYLAEKHGVNVIGVTIAKEQKAFIDARIKERGLEHLVEIRLQDYREVPETGFDSVSSIEMGEHVGAENYPTFVNLIHSRLRDGGRALIQQMSRRDRPGGGDFIEAYIATCT